MLECEKSGVGHHFSTYLENKGKRKQLISFRGHRFNHLFTAAGRTYHHRKDITNFLQPLSDPNELLKSVAFNITEPPYIISIKASGIIDKLLTCPFWRIIERKRTILKLNTYLGILKYKLEMYAHDAFSLILLYTMYNSDVWLRDFPDLCFYHL
jgi:E1A/CREB-binding protein